MELEKRWNIKNNFSNGLRLKFEVPITINSVKKEYIDSIIIDRKV